MGCRQAPAKDTKVCCFCLDSVVRGSWELSVLRRRLVHQLCLETARCLSQGSDLE